MRVDAPHYPVPLIANRGSSFCLFSQQLVLSHFFPDGFIFYIILSNGGPVPCSNDQQGRRFDMLEFIYHGLRKDHIGGLRIVEGHGGVIGMLRPTSQYIHPLVIFRFPSIVVIEFQLVFFSGLIVCFELILIVAGRWLYKEPPVSSLPNQLDFPV